MSVCNTAISVSGLTKRYQDTAVLKGISFSVPSGTVFTLLGSNGAGKTTTVRILTTQQKADSGNIEITGYDVSKHAQKIHERISLTGQFSAVDEALTGRENLVLMGRLLHLSAPGKKAAQLLNYFELSASADQCVSSYSGGMKRKLDIAMSLVGNPRVLFLDEPTTGLDPQSRHKMWQMIRGLIRSGVTVFLTTQYIEEAEQLADMIAILDKGKIIAQGTPAQLRACLPHGAMQFTFPDYKNLEAAKALLQSHRISAASEERKLTVYTDGTANTMAELFHTLFQNKVHIQDFSKLVPNLEDVFLTMIKENKEK